MITDDQQKLIVARQGEVVLLLSCPCYSAEGLPFEKPGRGGTPRKIE